MIIVDDSLYVTKVNEYNYEHECFMAKAEIQDKLDKKQTKYRLTCSPQEINFDTDIVTIRD